MARHRISFPGSGFADLVLPAHSPLTLHLGPANSPVLFGCRAGLCGTCLVSVEVLSGRLAAPDAAEADALEVYAPGTPTARLACQIDLTADLAIEKRRIDSKGHG